MFRKFSLLALVLSMAGFLSAQTVDVNVIKNLNAELSQSYAKGDYDKALAAATKLVDLISKQSGRGSMDAAVALRNRAMVETSKGDLKAAEKSFDNAIDIYKKQPTLSNRDAVTLAEMLEALGTIKAKSNLVWTEPIFEEALKLREKINGPDSPETANALAHLGNIKFWQRKYNDSAQLYSRALKNLASNSASSTADITVVYHRTQCTYRKANIEDQFEPLRQLYSSAAEFTVTPVKSAKLINAGVVNGKALHLEKPTFPDEARSAPDGEGDVEVEILIDEQGRVISACGAKKRTHISLVEAAEIAAYKSTFSPTTLKGNPVKVSGRIVYAYRRRY